MVANTLDDTYLNLVDRILKTGVESTDRTGTGTYSLAEGVTITHDMAQGAPILTTKRIAPVPLLVELEGFIQGVTDKKWYQDNGCHIWDEWCNPKVVPYGNDEETKAKMAAERDLGPFYGFQWRHQDATYESFDTDYTGKGVDQLKDVLDNLAKSPDTRRAIVSATHPIDRDQMCLEPCHDGFVIKTRPIMVDRYDAALDINNGNEDKYLEPIRVALANAYRSATGQIPKAHIEQLIRQKNDQLLEGSTKPVFEMPTKDLKINGNYIIDLSWRQRSVDTMLGLPFNIASYGTLLHLIARQFDCQEGILSGHLDNVHIYKGHELGAVQQLRRQALPRYDLPRFETTGSKEVLKWGSRQTNVENYKYYPTIKFDVAV